MTRIAAPAYSSRIIKAGALPTDSRTFLHLYDPRLTASQNLKRLLNGNAFGKASRSRVQDILPIFRQRYLGQPSLVPVLKGLVEAQAPPDILERIFFFHAAKADALLYDFVARFLYQKSRRGEHALSGEEVRGYLTGLLRSEGLRWAPTTVRRVACGLLATVRDFKILDGAVRKRIAPVYLPPEAFLYVAHALSLDGASGERLVGHPDWRLFLLAPSDVESLFLEAHARKWIDYQVAGRLIRVEFRVATAEELVRAIAGREDQNAGGRSAR